MEPVLEELTRAIEVINTLAVAVAVGQAVTGVGSKESFHRDSMATLLRVWMNGLSHLRPMVLSMAGTRQIPCSEQSHTSRSYIHNAFGMQSTSMARLEIDRPSQGPALAVLQAQHAICSSFEQSALSHYNITAIANVMMLND